MAARLKPIEVDINVAERMRFARRARNLSQADVAEKIGVAYQQYQRYEVGKNRITAGRLALIANILELPIEWFFKNGPIHTLENRRAA